MKMNTNAIKHAIQHLGLVALMSGGQAFAALPTVPVEVPAKPTTAAVKPVMFSHGNFSCAPVYKPTGAVRGVVLLLTDSSTLKSAASACQNGMPVKWTDREESIAQTLVSQGALVAGVDIGALIRDQAPEGACLGFDGDLENFSRVLQARYQLPGYRTPLLVGRGRGSALAYGQLNSANKRTFSAAISLGFSSRIELPLPLCKGRALKTEPAAYDDSAPQPAAKIDVATAPIKRREKLVRYSLQPNAELDTPWIIIQQTRAGVVNKSLQTFITGMKNVTVHPEVDADSQAEQAALVAAFNQVQTYAVATAPPPAAVADLPLIEVAAKKAVEASTHNVLAIMISGDGGWAGIDRDLADLMSKKGVPVIGFDSLRYFWKARTPESTAKDVERIIRYYQSQPQWKREKILLIGYSQGADVMPFVVNRLSAETRAQLASVALLGLGKLADFEFHVTNWIQSSNDGLAILPEVKKMPPKLASCIYGDEDTDSMCPSLTNLTADVRIVRLPGDHHFNGAYGKLASQILQGVKETPAK